MSTSIEQLNMLCKGHGFDIVGTHAYTTLTTHEKLYCWATVREFPQHGTLIGQVSKLVEELGEFSEAASRPGNNNDAIADAFGDMVVVIGVMCVMGNYKLEDVISFTRRGRDYNASDIARIDAFYNVVSKIGELAGSISRQDSLNGYGYLRAVVYHLDILSSFMNFSLERCFQGAFAEIENRRGKMLDGVWVKEEDL